MAYVSLTTGIAGALLSAVTLRSLMGDRYADEVVAVGYLTVFQLEVLLGVIALVTGLVALRREPRRRMTATAGGLLGLLPVLAPLAMAWL